MMEKLRSQARALKKEIYALSFAARDPRVPWHAKALIFFVVAYTFSPIDLIPDFIPVLGYLDDLIIVPFGICWAIRLIPPEVLAEARTAASMESVDRRAALIGTGIILFVWILAIIWSAIIIFRLLEKP